MIFMKKINDDYQIKDLEENGIYYCDGFDGSAQYNFFAVTGEFFIASLAWKNHDTTFRFSEDEKDENFYFGIDKNAVKNLSVYDGYIALTEFTLEGYSSMTSGNGEENQFFEKLTAKPFESFVNEFDPQEQCQSHFF